MVEKIKNILCFTIIVALISTTVSAALLSDVEINVDSDSKKIIVTGLVEQYEDDQMVTVRIKKSGVATPETVYGIRQEKVQADGSFTISTILGNNAKGGPLKILVSGNGITNPIDEEHIYFDDDYIKTMVDELDKSSSDEIVFNEKLVYYAGLGALDIDLNEDFYKANTKNVEQIMRNTLALTEYDTAEDISLLFYACVAACKINKYVADEGANSDIGNIVRQYAKFCGLENIDEDDIKPDEADKYLLDKIDADAFDFVFGERVKSLKVVNDFIALKDLYREAYAIAKLNSSQKTDIATVLSVYNDDAFGLNLTGEYEKLDPVEVAKSLYDRAYLYVENIKKDFDKRVAELVKSANEKSYSSSSGGGSSSGSKGMIISQPVIIPDESDKNSESKAEFSDVSDVEWAIDGINYLCDIDVITGYSDGTFKPHNNVTRAEFIKMVVSALPSYETTKENIFDDVSKDDWYYSYVVSAFSMGLVNGNGTGFEPERQITRQEAVSILTRLVAKLGITLNKIRDYEIFGDDKDIKEYAKQNVLDLYCAGIISGFEDGSFKPNGYTTRAQAAKMIYEVLSMRS